MKTIDGFIDRFESLIADRGVEHCAPAEFYRACLEEGMVGELDADLAVELTRVWLEYRIEAGLPASPTDLRAQFPEIVFADTQLELLEFEHKRLCAEATEERLTGARRLGNRALPPAGSEWAGFSLLEVLGAGAFANVYLARQTHMARRLVALKLSTRKSDESQLLARLHHSAIVPIYSIHESQGIYGVCMPYLGNTTLIDLLHEMGLPSLAGSRVTRAHDGSSLLEILADRHQRLSTVVELSAPSCDTQAVQAAGQTEPTTGLLLADESPRLRTGERAPTAQQLARLTYVEAITWMGAQLADALAHAHRQGVLHCDIKPGNILLASDGQPRLLDFNVALAKNLIAHGPEYFRQSKQQSRAVGGTPPYMAPEHLAAIEQGRPELIDARSDIYSLGVVLFEMLTGKLPGAAGSEPDFDAAHALQQDNPTTSLGLRWIIKRCLQREPANRYQSADALFEDLHAQANLRPLPHQREPLRQRVWKWMRRHPTTTSVSSVASVAVLLLTLAGAALVWRGAHVNKLQRAQRGQQFLSMLPDALSLNSVVSEYPDLAEVAAERSLQTLACLQADDVLQRQHAQQLQQLLGTIQRDLLPPAMASELNSATAEQLRTMLQTVEDRLSNALETAAEPFESSYAQGDFNAAILLARERMEERKADYAFMLKLGICYLKQADYTGASESFSSCTALRPELAVGWFYRGIARLKAERGAEAEQDFRKALQLEPRFTAARFNQALAQDLQGQRSAALATLTAGIDQGWRSIPAYAKQAQWLAVSGQSEQAQQARERALGLAPSNERDYLEQGLLLLPDAPDKAAAAFANALKLNPDSSTALQNLAHVYAEQLGRPEQALTCLQRLTTLHPQHPGHWAARGVVEARLAQGKAALASLARAGGLRPTQPLVAYQLACGFSLLGGLSDPQTTAEVSDLPTTDQLLNSTKQWYSYAARLDHSVSQLLNSDPDMAWFRQHNQPASQEN